MARQETGRVNGTSIFHNLTYAFLTEFGNAEYSLETMEWPERREKREKNGKTKKNWAKLWGIRPRIIGHNESRNT